MGIDLKTIKEELEKREYETLSEFATKCNNENGVIKKSKLSFVFSGKRCGVCANIEILTPIFVNIILTCCLIDDLMQSVR